MPWSETGGPFKGGTMTKQEFLTSLQETLAAEMNGQQVMDQVRYYSAYIDGQIAEGRTEAEVLAELGDARIIARNILDGAEQENSGYSEEIRTAYAGENDGAEGGWQSKLKVYGCLGLALAALFVVIAFVTRLIIWLLPSILVAALLIWIFKQFDKR